MERKRKQKENLTIGTVPKANKKIVARGSIDTFNNKNTSHLPGLVQHFTKKTKTSCMGPTLLFPQVSTIRVITKLPNSEQSSKGKVKTHKYINRQNQSTTGKL
jgi:hypothetical protein